MQSKKVEDALGITHGILRLLAQHPYAANAPLSVTKQIQSDCDELLSCLSILHSFELDEATASGDGSGDLAQDASSQSLKRESIYALVSKTLSQVVEFRTDECSGVTEALTKGTDYCAPKKASPHSSTVARRSHTRRSQQTPNKKKKPQYAAAVRTMPSNVDKNETFDAVCGCEEVVAILKQCILLPSRLPFLFKGPRRSPQRILLYGPPGTGKTLLVTAAAQSTDPPCALLCVSASQLLSKWVGESEKQLEKIFRHAKKLAHPTPQEREGPEGGDAGDHTENCKRRRCIIFFDEIDALCSARGHQSETELSRRIKTEFLLHLNRIQTEGILVMAATNLPWEIDSAIRRRFDRFVYVDLPSPKARLALLRKYLAVDARVDHCLSPQEVKQIIHKTTRFSSADLVNVIQQAFMKPLAPLMHCTHLRHATDEDWQAYLDTNHMKEGSLTVMSASSLHSSLQSVFSDARPIVLNLKKRREPEEPDTTLSTESRRRTMAKHNSETDDFTITAHLKDRRQFATWYVPCPADSDGLPISSTSILSLQKLRDVGVGGESSSSTPYVLEEQILVPPLRYAHFAEVLIDFIPSVTEDELNKFKQWSGSQTPRDDP